MRRSVAILLTTQAAIVAAFAIAIRSGRVPLGVPGEWEWLKISAVPTIGAVAVGIVGIAGFSAFAWLGYRSMAGKTGPLRETAWLAGLVVAATLAQGFVQEGAPEGYGLSKWILALYSPGSSGYYTVARTQMADPGRFLTDYPTWIARQDALHVGTHPPGLFLVARGMLGLMESNPKLAKGVGGLVPGSVDQAIRVFRESQGLPGPDGASLAMTGALTLMACASTVVPLYLLARSSLPASTSWVSAALWPMVPSALLFQPTADTAFPLLSTTAIALAAWARRRESWPLGIASGVVMAVGMEFTLAFLPVGLIVALVVLAPGEPKLSRRLGLVASIGVGFLGSTLAWWAAMSSNPFEIWWVNQRNHARFYAEYHRSYLAWVVANPIELAVGLGLPATVLILLGFGSPRKIPRSTWATLGVLVFLTLSGRSLSEVGRLWLPFMPMLLVAAGLGLDRVRAGGRTLAATLAMVGLQSLILEATIQVVYPI